MKRFVDIRTGQVVNAEPCLSAIHGGAAFRLHYPEGHKATISRDVFNEYYHPLWPEKAPA